MSSLTHHSLLLYFVYGKVCLDVGLGEDVELDVDGEVLVVGVLTGGLKNRDENLESIYLLFLFI